MTFDVKRLFFEKSQGCLLLPAHSARDASGLFAKVCCSLCNAYPDPHLFQNQDTFTCSERSACCSPPSVSQTWL